MEVLEVKCPDPSEDPRYRRQIPLIGKEGQDRLYKSKVAIIGLGGLGSIVSQYMAAAGVGHIKIIDPDIVEADNLNRQLLYDTASIGLPKSPLAAKKLKSINPCIEVEWFQERIDSSNMDKIIGEVDLIIDCLDNWETRLILDEYSQRRATPLLHAAIESFYGQLYLSVPGETACLRCIAPKKVARKSSIPVIGAAVGVVASLESTLALQFLLGTEAIKGTLILVDVRSMNIDKIPIDPRTCPCPGRST